MLHTFRWPCVSFHRYWLVGSSRRQHTGTLAHRRRGEPGTKSKPEKWFLNISKPKTSHTHVIISTFLFIVIRALELACPRPSLARTHSFWTHTDVGFFFFLESWLYHSVWTEWTRRWCLPRPGLVWACHALDGLSQLFCCFFFLFFFNVPQWHTATGWWYSTAAFLGGQPQNAHTEVQVVVSMTQEVGSAARTICHRNIQLNTIASDVSLLETNSISSTFCFFPFLFSTDSREKEMLVCGFAFNRTIVYMIASVLYPSIAAWLADSGESMPLRKNTSATSVDFHWSIKN